MRRPLPSASCRAARSLGPPNSCACEQSVQRYPQARLVLSVTKPVWDPWFTCTFAITGGVELPRLRICSYKTLLLSSKRAGVWPSRSRSGRWGSPSSCLLVSAICDTDSQESHVLCEADARTLLLHSLTLHFLVGGGGGAAGMMVIASVCCGGCSRCGRGGLRAGVGPPYMSLPWPHSSHTASDSYHSLSYRTRATMRRLTSLTGDLIHGCDSHGRLRKVRVTG